MSIDYAAATAMFIEYAAASFIERNENLPRLAFLCNMFGLCNKDMLGLDAEPGRDVLRYVNGTILEPPHSETNWPKLFTEMKRACEEEDRKHVKEFVHAYRNFSTEVDVVKT